MINDMIWPNNDINSEYSQKLINAKNINDENFWPTMREILENDVNNLSLERFRNWASARIIPIITQRKTAAFFGAAFSAAINEPIFYKALKENWIGALSESTRKELRVVDDVDTSMQRIADVAHLVIGGFTVNDINSYSSILEIGGGYGDMCSVIHNLGYSGKYTIYDLPEMQKIQKFYLNKQNISPTFINGDPSQLENNYDLVIGTWSLSEIPESLREQIVEKIYDSKNWLIVYQSNVFNDENIDTFFKTKFEKKNAVFSLLWKSEYDGDNIYMIIKE